MSLTRRRWPVVLAMLVSLGGGAAPAAQSDDEGTRLNLVPFAMEITAAITADEIDKVSPVALWLAQSHPFPKELERWLTERPTTRKLDSGAIRLRAQFADRAYVVDKFGVVARTDTGRRFELAEARPRDIEKRVEALIGVIDLKLLARSPRLAPK
jgi:hypothetical protein